MRRTKNTKQNHVTPHFTAIFTLWMSVHVKSIGWKCAKPVALPFHLMQFSCHMSCIIPWYLVNGNHSFFGRLFKRNTRKLNSKCFAFYWAILSYRINCRGFHTVMRRKLRTYLKFALRLFWQRELCRLFDTQLASTIAGSIPSCSPSRSPPLPLWTAFCSPSYALMKLAGFA